MEDQVLVDNLIKIALNEDLGELGDITTQAVVPESKRVKAAILTKSEGIVAGIKVASRVFELVDSSLTLKEMVKDGQKVKRNDVLLQLEGQARSILIGERTALNFLQHLSGIATFTSLFVEKVKNYPVKILDTRKTTPGLRWLEKYAVRVGGGHNNRFGLYDGILIKDNHLKIVGSVSEAVKKARAKIPKDMKIEVEVETLIELKEALEAGADVVMLDNMSLETMKKAVEMAKGSVILEASGGVTISNIEEIAQTGINWISIGALTQAAPPLDVSLEILAGD